MKRALYLDPFEWLVSFNLGLINIAMEQYASAFHHLYVAINFKADHAHLYMYLGLCLNRLEDFPNACMAMERAVDLEKNDPLIILNYAIMLGMRPGNEEKARVLMSKFDAGYHPQKNNPNGEEIKAQRAMLEKVLRG